MRIVGFAIALAVSLGLALPAAAATPDQNGRADRFATVTRYVDTGYQSLGLPGASLLVVQDGRVVYERYFGGG